MSSQWSLLVVTAETIRPVALSTARTVTVGQSEANVISLSGPSIASIHCAFSVRDQQVRLELMKGHAGTLLNGIPLSGTTLLHDGDEVSVGTAHILVMRDKPGPDRGVRLIPWDECVERLDEDVQRAGTFRPVAFALVEMPSLNAAAKQALVRRVREEIADINEVAVLAEFSADVLAVLLSEPSAPSLERLQTRLQHVAGARARAVVSVSNAQHFTGNHVLLHAIDTLWPVTPGREFLTQHSLLVRLAERLVDPVKRAVPLMIRGAPGSGRAALARHVASLAGLSPELSPVVMHDVDRLSIDALERGMARFHKQDRSKWLTAAPGFQFAGVQRVVDLPSLASRGNDVLVIASAELARLRSMLGRSRLALTSEAHDALLAWTWPGQTRELLAVINRAAHAALGDEIGSEVFPSRMLNTSTVLPLPGARESAEKRLLLEALARTRWNVSAAAVRLGVPRRTLVYRMARLKMRRPTSS